MSTIKPGRYRHYKGKEYQVLFTATSSEDLSEYVVYKALYDDQKIWARPASMWNEQVESGGKNVKRFEYIGD